MAIVEGFNKMFENKARLGIMSVLAANESVDFPTLKSLLNLTDGNLASHARSLEDAGYIECEKQFVGRKPNTKYRITEKGLEAFSKHIDAMESFLKSVGRKL